MQRSFIFSTAFICLTSAACGSSSNNNATSGNGSSTDNGGGTSKVVSKSEPSVLAAQQSGQSVNDNADTSANAQNYGSSGYGVNDLSVASLVGNPNRGGRDNGPGHRPDCMQVSSQGGGAVDANGVQVAFSFSFDNCAAGDPNGATMDGNCTISITHNPNDPNAPAQIGFGIDSNRHFPDGSEMHIQTMPDHGGQPQVTVDTNGTISADGNSVVTRTITAVENRVDSLNGNVTMDMNITLESVTSVDYYTSGALVERVINGNTTVHHNRLGETSTHVYNNVTEVFSQCDCYPISGSVQQTTVLDGNATVVLDRTFTFTSTCGTVDVNTTTSLDPNIATGAATLTLDACND